MSSARWLHLPAKTCPDITLLQKSQISWRDHRQGPVMERTCVFLKEETHRHRPHFQISRWKDVGHIGQRNAATVPGTLLGSFALQLASDIRYMLL